MLDQGLRYIRNGDGTVEVYDFESDPAEGTNLSGAAERQTEIDRLRRLVDSARTEHR